MNLDDVLDALAAKVADRVTKQVLAALGKQSELPYSSDDLPPFASKRLFNTWCRSGRVRGARREGKGPSTRWFCDRFAWEQARTTTPEATSDEEAKIAGYIGAAGLRLTARVGRGR